MTTLPVGQDVPLASSPTACLLLSCARLRQATKGTAILLLALASITTTGCVALIPSVSQGRGRVLLEADANFIKIGETTREEVIQRLGTEFSDTWRTSALAYSWELKSVDLNIVGFSTIGGGADKTGFPRWRALFVAFDSNGIVTKRELVRLSPEKALHAQLTAWEGRKILP